MTVAVTPRLLMCKVCSFIRLYVFMARACARGSARVERQMQRQASRLPGLWLGWARDRADWLHDFSGIVAEKARRCLARAMID